ncbi:MAG: cell division protein FtsQ/DivIB [Microgenomates group bacterium]
MRQSLSLKRFYQQINNLIFSILIITSFFILLYFLNVVFTVKEIQIEGDSKISPLVGLEDLSGKNLFFLDTSDTKKKLKINNPQVKEISITKIFPHTIKINLSLYKPQAAIAGGDIYFYLAEDGRILFKTRRQNLALPIIYYYQKFSDYNFQTGEWINYKDLNTALRIIKLLSDLGIVVDRVDIETDNMIVFKIDEKRIFISSEKNEEKTVYELTKIIKQLKIEGKGFETLDLRFKNPIIKF